jgi:SNF2 family DNA or RNA helicase
MGKKLYKPQTSLKICTVEKIMLNFRKLRQDFSTSILKEGKELFDALKVLKASILEINHKTIKLQGRVQGQYDNVYESTIEIDRIECETIDSDCDCPYNYDCQHIAALMLFFEQNYDATLADFSNSAAKSQIEESEDMSDDDKDTIISALKEAEKKVTGQKELNIQKEILEEYQLAAKILADSPFFSSNEFKEKDFCELLLIYAISPQNKGLVDFQIGLRLPTRSKPINIPNLKKFVESIKFKELIYMHGKCFKFDIESFPQHQKELVKKLVEHTRFFENTAQEKQLRQGQIPLDVFGEMLHHAYFAQNCPSKPLFSDEETLFMEGFFDTNLDTPLKVLQKPAKFHLKIEYLKPPLQKFILMPYVKLQEQVLKQDQMILFSGKNPGLMHQGMYVPFESQITHSHIQSLKQLEDLIIPEPLFGSFIETSLKEISTYASFEPSDIFAEFPTLPVSNDSRAVCELVYLNGELEAELKFDYSGKKIPAIFAKLDYADIESFVKECGIVSRDLVFERRLLEDLFQDFLFNEQNGIFFTKSEKKIVEFMTDVVPRNKHRVEFNCPENLLDQFIYDDTTFKLKFDRSERVDVYQICLEINGPLKGVRVDMLWDCIASRRSYIELNAKSQKTKKPSKILVLDIDRLSPIVHLFDELGIEVIETSILDKPLWSLGSVDKETLQDLPIEFEISDRLLEIREQILGQKQIMSSPIPEIIKADLRSYQQEGVRWLERVRSMHLGGILADDMGLGKTLQAIVAISQLLEKEGGQALIVCPTSLLYNWKEELGKFNPKLKALVVDGIPQNRKKLIDSLCDYDVVITSYTLLQKDLEAYQATVFKYVVLDEAQHIKNRGTRNAKSVKAVRGEYRLILSGTPIENALEELWSLFDFLMPGFLSSYERFVEKYIRPQGALLTKNLEYLKRKVGPFIMRRMKVDVLHDLPPVSEIVYHCQLTPAQMELYKSYAQSARDELTKLVAKEGFDRVQIHVLATLTRLKQICCHPAIFAKDEALPGDSAKYDMLMDLVDNLIQSNKKSVIFSQYTKMLKILKDDLEKKGIKISYLDGSSKNRLETVKEFNEDASIKIFLVSLKAGGTGLNLVGADTVIHYDMWWNPAIEAQATDRVHRMGQKSSVSSYKLITLGTIEEKIAEMQQRKKGLVKKVVSCDDEAMTKLTWEDVLELLKT